MLLPTTCTSPNNRTHSCCYSVLFPWFDPPAPVVRSLLPTQELPADLSAEQAQAPGCAGLVQDMCGLFERLKQLSHLGTTDEGLEVGGGL